MRDEVSALRASCFSSAELAARWAPPLLAPLMMVAAWLAGPKVFETWVSAPDSVFENLLGLVLVAALISALALITRRETRRHPGVRAWLAIWCLAVFYFLGEDLNWGQYLFGWTPSDFFPANNKEAESNLHNMNSWFNQKPRMVVQLWVLVAGVLVPLGWSAPRRWLARIVPSVLWPGRETIALALATTLIPVAEWLAHAAFGADQAGVPIRFSEIQEFFFAWFMLLYAIDLGARMRAQRFETANRMAATPAE